MAPPQGGEYIQAEAARTNQRGDHNDPQCHHDRLIDAGEDGRHRQRHLHLRQRLPGGRAEHLGRLDASPWNLANPQVGEANNGGHRVDNRGDDAGDPSNAKEQSNRYQVYKSRHCLHEVEERPQGSLHPVAAGRPHPEWDTNQQGQDDRQDHECEGSHALFPEADRSEIDHPGRSQNRRTQPADPGEQNKDDRNDHKPGEPENEVFQSTDRPVNRVADGIEEPREQPVSGAGVSILGPGLEVIHGVRQADVPRLRKTFHRCEYHLEEGQESEEPSYAD